MSKLIVLGISLGQFYSQYALKQYLAIQDTPYLVANFWTEKYFNRLLPGVPSCPLLEYMNSDWQKCRALIKNLPFESIDFFFAPVTRGLSPRSVELFRKGTFTNPEKGMSFSSSFKEYKKILFCIDSGLPVKHIINDPLEIDLSSFGVQEEFFYEIPGRARASDYIHREIALQDGPSRKDLSFTFGFSNVARNSSRNIYYDQFKKSGLPFFYKGPQEDNYISTDEYNKLLCRSRYSYIIPSYDSDHFSYIRYLEALHRGCTPLIHPDCNLKWFKGPELRQMQSLVTPIDEIKDRIS